MSDPNRIDACFAKLREEGRTALIPFLTAGDPDLETSERLILEMADAGADVIEIGVPFSDPTAEGPTIQVGGSDSYEARCRACHEVPRTDRGQFELEMTGRAPEADPRNRRRPIPRHQRPS